MTFNTYQLTLFISNRSHNWVCEECGQISKLLAENNAKPITKEESELIKSVTFKVLNHFPLLCSYSTNYKKICIYCYFLGRGPTKCFETS